MYVSIYNSLTLLLNGRMGVGGESAEGMGRDCILNNSTKNR